MSIHRIDELPRGVLLLDELTVPVRDRVAVFADLEWFWRVADYTRSQPTSPSGGRVYRKNLGWPTDVDDNWWLYVVLDVVPDDPVLNGSLCGGPYVDGQLHHPFRPVAA